MESGKKAAEKIREEELKKERILFKKPVLCELDRLVRAEIPVTFSHQKL